MGHFNLVLPLLGLRASCFGRLFNALTCQTRAPMTPHIQSWHNPISLGCWESSLSSESKYRGCGGWGCRYSGDSHIKASKREGVGSHQKVDIKDSVKCEVFGAFGMEVEFDEGEPSWQGPRSLPLSLSLPLDSMLSHSASLMPSHTLSLSRFLRLSRTIARTLSLPLSLAHVPLSAARV